MKKFFDSLALGALFAGNFAVPRITVNNPQYHDGQTKRTTYRLTETWHDRRNAAQKAELYASTPKHGPTRQQRRAQGKAWRNSPARVAECLARMGE